MAKKQKEKKNESKPIEEEVENTSEEQVQEAAEDAKEEEGIPMVMIPAEEYEALKAESENTQAEMKRNVDGWQRERADFSNFKKRIEREQVQRKLDITGEIIKKYLPAMDDMERALKAKPAEGEGAEWADGINLIYRKLTGTIETFGAVRIEADNAMFDPTIHEAITSEPSEDHESGEIIEVIQQGYKLGERVLRPALVRVAQ